MVNDAGYPLFHGGDRREQGAVINGLQIQRLVERPPQILQDFVKVGGLYGQCQPAGIGTVEMHVGVSQPGHQQTTCAINLLIVGITLLEFPLRADGFNTVPFDGQGLVP